MIIYFFDIVKLKLRIRIVGNKMFSLHPSTEVKGLKMIFYPRPHKS